MPIPDGEYNKLPIEMQRIPRAQIDRVYDDYVARKKAEQGESKETSAPDFMDYVKRYGPTAGKIATSGADALADTNTADYFNALLNIYGAYKGFSEGDYVQGAVSTAGAAKGVDDLSGGELGLDTTAVNTGIGDISYGDIASGAAAGYQGYKAIDNFQDTGDKGQLAGDLTMTAGMYFNPYMGTLKLATDAFSWGLENTGWGSMGGYGNTMHPKTYQEMLLSPMLHAQIPELSKLPQEEQIKLLNELGKSGFLGATSGDKNRVQNFQNAIGDLTQADIAGVYRSESGGSPEVARYHRARSGGDTSLAVGGAWHPKSARGKDAVALQNAGMTSVRWDRMSPSERNEWIRNNKHLVRGGVTSAKSMARFGEVQDIIDKYTGNYKEQGMQQGNWGMLNTEDMSPEQMKAVEQAQQILQGADIDPLFNASPEERRKAMEQFKEKYPDGKMTFENMSTQSNGNSSVFDNGMIGGKPIPVGAQISTLMGYPEGGPNPNKTSTWDGERWVPDQPEGSQSLQSWDQLQAATWGPSKTETRPDGTQISTADQVSPDQVNQFMQTPMGQRVIQQWQTQQQGQSSQPSQWQNENNNYWQTYRKPDDQALTEGQKNYAQSLAEMYGGQSGR